ncbi:MAG TPA: restriction endonuclease [Nitrospirota bacterium]|nr:restriction endonuclease [Nitrospirota bacterium]
MASKGITRSRTGQLLQALFKILIANNEGIPAKDAINELEKKVQPTEYEKGEYETGGTRFNKIVRFCTVDAVKAGWMTKNKGIWTITEEGKNALTKFKNPEDFHKEASRLYWKWRRSTPIEQEAPEEPTQELKAKITFEEAEEQAWKEITEYLENIDPYDLQNLVAALLQAMGYYVNWIAQQGKDGGIDIVAWNDPLGTKPPRIKVQVKRRKDNIKVDELRGFLSLINEGDVGIFLTTGGFTKDAEELARAQERRKITLLDSQKLVDLWIEYNDKLEKDKRYLLPLQPIYFLAPNN